MTAQTLTQSHLKELIHYDPDTGIITRKKGTKGHAAGDVLGTPCQRGLKLMVEGKSYLAHRLAWLYMKGNQSGRLRHINGILSDNRISNLSTTPVLLRFLETQEDLKRFLKYDAETGVFTNVKSRPPAVAGSVAGSIDAKGYVVIGLCSKVYKAHRLAWLYVHGEFPTYHIDHINHAKTDNRICNLRAVSQAENNRNRGRSKNMTGVNGVNYVHRLRQWRVTIGCSGASHVGIYKNFSDAVTARKAAEIEHGYHPNHGGGRGNVAKEKPKTPEMIARLESYK